jgi:hypothetical protein
VIIAFCVATYGNGMTQDRIERALPRSTSLAIPAFQKTAYIRRTMEKARYGLIVKRRCIAVSLFLLKRVEET